MDSPQRSIATLNEGPLHAALKEWCAQPGDLTEVPMDGRQIDLVRGQLLIEIQTSGLCAIRKKLSQLLERHHVHLIHPVVQRRWIVRTGGPAGQRPTRRKSPREGTISDAFRELVSLPGMLSHPRLTMELLLIDEEQVRSHAPGRAWRRKGWVTVERRLVRVVESFVFRSVSDWQQLLPAELPGVFTTADLGDHLSVSRDLAQKIAYCFRQSGVIQQVGKQGNARTYRSAA